MIGPKWRSSRRNSITYPYPQVFSAVRKRILFSKATYSTLNRK
jgi:hypothetical protein